MRNTKRIFAALLSMALVSGAMAGCGNGGNSSSSSTSSTSNQASNSAEKVSSSNLTAPGEFPIVKEQETLTIASFDRPNVGPLADTQFYKWYEEKTNIKVEFTEILKEAIKEKVNLMIVSDNLPDAFLSLAISNPDQTKYGAEGIFLPLNQLIEEQGTEMKKIFTEYPQAESTITTPDGNIYALPLINDCFHCRYFQRAWINQTWLDQLGLKMPTTTAEFETVLQAFKDKDPNGNGKADEIPMIGFANSAYASVIPFLTSAFVLDADSNTMSSKHLFLDKDKKVQFVGGQPEYKDALLWIRSLIEKGLIDPASLTQTSEQAKQLIQNPEATIVGTFTHGTLSAMTGTYGGTPNNLITQYAALPPLEGPNGFRGTPTRPTSAIGGGSFLITKNCKNPEAAYRWADGQFSEEATIKAWYGFEGDGYNLPKEGSVGLNGEPALFDPIIIPDESPEQLRLVQNYLGNNSAKLREGIVADNSTEKGRFDLENILYRASKESYAPYGKDDMALPSTYWLPEEAEEFTTLNTQINEYYDEQTALFLLGSKSIETEWDAFVAELNNLGMPRMLELLQNSYERQFR